MVSLKEKVLQMISTTQDENLLELVKADIQYFNDKKTEILDDLYYSDKEELLKLTNEPMKKTHYLKKNLKMQHPNGVSSNM